MKKFILAVVLDHTIESGGNFQQSLNNIFLAQKLVSKEIDVSIYVPKVVEKSNFEYLTSLILLPLLHNSI